jgi:hypothetical protein
MLYAGLSIRGKIDNVWCKPFVRMPRVLFRHSEYLRFFDSLVTQRMTPVVWWDLVRDATLMVKFLCGKKARSQHENQD